MADWYLQDGLEQTRHSTVKALPLPQADDAKNLSYAGQWLLFASIAIVGWFYFLRREAKEQVRAHPSDYTLRADEECSPDIQAHEHSTAHRT